MTAVPVLDPAQVHRLARLRLRLRRRIDGRFVGGHPARGYGASQDFTDFRAYVPGDDPRLLDPHAWVRHRKLLLRQYAAEDTAAVSIVVDGSRSMIFSGKARAARAVAAALAVVVIAGGDRVRIAIAGRQLVSGPWYAGGAGMAAALVRLGSATGSGMGAAGSAGAPAQPGGDADDPGGGDGPDWVVDTAGGGSAGEEARGGPGGEVDLAAALDRLRRQGQRGPIVLVSDLLTPAWPDVLARLGADRHDALLVHLLGRDELDPQVSGDVRLVDAETGHAVELAVAEPTLARYRATRDAWLDGIARACGARAIDHARHIAGDPVERLVAADLRRLGWVT